MKLKKRLLLALASVGLLSCLYCTALFLQLVYEGELLKVELRGNNVIGKQLQALKRSSQDVSEHPAPTYSEFEASRTFVPKNKEAPPKHYDTIAVASKEVLYYKHIKDITDEASEKVREVMNSHRKSKRRKGERLNIYSYAQGMYIPAWVQFHNEISRYELYNEETSPVDRLLHDMAHSKIVDSVMRSGGTQLKLMMSFEDEGQAMMKPMRFPRHMGTLPDHFYFVDFERHVAEIAAFHLDRVLGFRRVPPCAGRLFNITSEIRTFASDDFKRTFFISPAGNLCFHGVCSYYCDTSHAFCGRPDTIEGSLCAYLPHLSDTPRKTWRHPWKRSYSKTKLAVWETDAEFCEKVRSLPPYNKGRRLLDIMDLAVFDFLIGNQDRHHYEIFEDFGNDTFILHLDQGRAFGRPDFDDMSILTPIMQCCLIRDTTYHSLQTLDSNSDNITLAQLVKHAMDVDVVAPIQTEQNLLALDRRVKIILDTLKHCITRKTRQHVVIDDGF